MPSLLLWVGVLEWLQLGIALASGVKAKQGRILVPVKLAKADRADDRIGRLRQCGHRIIRPSNPAAASTTTAIAIEKNARPRRDRRPLDRGPAHRRLTDHLISRRGWHHPAGYCREP